MSYNKTRFKGGPKGPEEQSATIEETKNHDYACGFELSLQSYNFLFFVYSWGCAVIDCGEVEANLCTIFIRILRTIQ